MSIRPSLRPGAAIVTTLFSLSLAAVSSEARADDDAAPATPPPEATPPSIATASRFGRAGEVVLGDVLSLGYGAPAGALQVAQPYVGGWVGYSDATFDLAGQTEHSHTIFFAPSIDVFVKSGFSIGGDVVVAFSGASPNAASNTGLLARPRLGWAFPMGPSFAFWPRVFGSFGVNHSTAIDAQQGVPGQPSSTTISWGMGAEALLVATLVEPLAVTFGPNLAYAKEDTDGESSQGLPPGHSVSLGVRGGLALVF